MSSGQTDPPKATKATKTTSRKQPAAKVDRKATANGRAAANGAASSDRAGTTRSRPSGDGTAMPISTGDGVSRPLKTAEGLARDLVREIVTQGLRTGDRLPSEAAMLEQFGLSRESLREGLRLLEVQGLITLRRGPGGGPVVGHLDPANLGRTSTLFYHLAGGTYAELLDAWVVTEAILAERAARNEDRDAVRVAMAPFLEEDHDAGDDEAIAEFVLAHTHFHAVVASLAENRVLEVMLQTIGQIVTHHVLANADPRNQREIIEAEHTAVAQAIVAGQPSKASKAMEDHINTMIAVYRESLGAQLHDFIDWR